MARGDRSNSGDEEVLSPEELDIARDENVATLGSGRYVVGSDGPPDKDRVEKARAELASAADSTTAHANTNSESSTTDEEASAGAGTGSDTADADSPNTRPIDGQAVKAWIDEQLDASDSRYAYRIAAKSGDRVSHQQLASDDIGMAFDALLMWYAQQVGRGTAVEEALGILLAESSIRVRYPTRRLLAYLDTHDLGPNDSIADLIEVVHDNDGLVFPPSERNHD